jgi:hypothetical protein
MDVFDGEIANVSRRAYFLEVVDVRDTYRDLYKSQFFLGVSELGLYIRRADLPCGYSLLPQFHSGIV